MNPPTNDYLLSSAIPVKIDDKSIGLPEIILEPSESYTIKALILHPSESKVDIEVIGKVASVKEISLVKSISKNEKKSFWKIVFQGDFLIQLGRLPSYFFGFIISMLFIFGPIAFVSDALSKRRRNKIVKQFKSYSEENSNEKFENMFDNYIQNGLFLMVEMKKILLDKDKLDDLYDSKETKPDENVESDESHGVEMLHTHFEGEMIHHRPNIRMAAKSLLKELNLLKENHRGEIVTNTEMVEIFVRFIDFVLIKQS